MLSDANGGFAYTSEHTIASIATLTCNPGFVVSGTNPVMCQATGWTGMPTCERKSMQSCYHSNVYTQSAISALQKCNSIRTESLWCSCSVTHLKILNLLQKLCTHLIKVCCCQYYTHTAGMFIISQTSWAIAMMNGKSCQCMVMPVRRALKALLEVIRSCQYVDTINLASWLVYMYLSAVLLSLSELAI